MLRQLRHTGAKNRARQANQATQALHRSKAKHCRLPQKNATNCNASLRGKRPAGPGPLRGLALGAAFADFRKPLTRQGSAREARQELCQPVGFVPNMHELNDQLKPSIFLTLFCTLPV
jgi:hypothetical protein